MLFLIFIVKAIVVYYIGKSLMFYVDKNYYYIIYSHGYTCYIGVDGVINDEKYKKYLKLKVQNNNYYFIIHSWIILSILYYLRFPI